MKKIALFGLLLSMSIGSAYSQGVDGKLLITLESAETIETTDDGEMCLLRYIYNNSTEHDIKGLLYRTEYFDKQGNLLCEDRFTTDRLEYGQDKKVTAHQYCPASCDNVKTVVMNEPGVVLMDRNLFSLLLAAEIRERTIVSSKVANTEMKK